VSTIEQTSPPAAPASGTSIPLTELAELVLLHARAQGIAPDTCRRVIASVDTAEPVGADGTERGTWTWVWSSLARQYAAAGRPLEASRYYNLARFPHGGDEPRRRAAAACVHAFDTWRRRTGMIERLELDLPGGRVACWTAGLGAGRPRPLLVVMGGIVSPKEQWAPFLLAARRLDMPVLVTEMPSVGENTLVYGPAATDMLPQVLDRLGPATCAPGVHVVGLSFAGHLAMAAARHDPRIRGVLTVGAPVSRVFADPATWARLPRTTTATLAHLTRTEPGRTQRVLAPMALRPADLAALDIPVRYVASRRDEIVSRREWELLAEHVADMEWIEFDDVHGSPAHLIDTRLWLLRHVLLLRGDRRAGLLGAALALRGRSARGGTTATSGPRRRDRR
jgi:hypothetical protein